MPRSSKRLIFSTDLDGTMIGHEKSEVELETFTKLWETSLRPSGGILVFNTGRSLKAYNEMQNMSKFLGNPDWLICGNGCEIYRIIDGKPVLNDTWDAFISERYSKAVLEKGMNKFDEVVVANLSIDDKHRHAITLQKLDQDPVQVKKRLERKFPNARFHLKEACTWLSGAHLLEAYPANATKSSALEFVTEMIQSEQEFHTDFQVIWAGDAYNDRSLCDSDYKGIIVGNAETALKKECDRSKHYFASQHTAAGVIEGLQHFGYVDSSFPYDALKVVALTAVGVLSYFVLRKLRHLGGELLKTKKN